MLLSMLLHVLLQLLFIVRVLVLPTRRLILSLPRRLLSQRRGGHIGAGRDRLGVRGCPRLLHQPFVHSHSVVCLSTEREESAAFGGGGTFAQFGFFF